MAYIRIRRTLSKGAKSLVEGDLASAVEAITSSIDQLRATESIGAQSKHTYTAIGLKTARDIITTL